MQQTKWQDDPRVGRGTQTNCWTCTKARKAQGGEGQFHLRTCGGEGSPGRLPREVALELALRTCGRRKKCIWKHDAAETRIRKKPESTTSPEDVLNPVRHKALNWSDF